MHPILVKIGSLPLHSYGFMLAMGFLIGLYFARRDAPKFGFNPDVISDAAFWVLLLAIAGTRTAFIAMYPENFSWKNPLGWFAIWEGGLVFQGAIPPAIVFVYFWTRRHNMGFWNTCDLAAPWLALGHAIGRIGCFLNGCCYGARTDAFCGISFPKGSPVFIHHVRAYGLDPTAAWSYHVHPTQLYSSAGLFVLCILLLTLRKYCRPFHGATAAYYFVFYGIGRFFIEMVRDDQNPVYFWNLTAQQIFSTLSIVAGVLLFVVLGRLKRRHVARKAASKSKTANTTK